MGGARHITLTLPPLRSARLRVIPSAPGVLRRLTLTLVTIVLLLVGVGVLMVQSSSQVVAIADGQNPYAGLLRQGSYAVVGVGLMLALSQVPVALLRKLTWLGLLLGFMLQILVYTPLGYEAGGNRNWLRLGPLSAQPAEFMKFVLLVWISGIVATKHRVMSHWLHVIIPILPVVALSMFINIQGGDLGTLMILTALIFGCLYFSQVRLRILGGLALVAAAGIAVMTLIKPNRVIRIVQFMQIDCLNDAQDTHGMCWQSLNGFWALSNGGMWGTGVGNSAAKWSWLPEADTDFIFAIIGEELGLIGACLILACFTVLAGVLVLLMRHCHTPFTVSMLGGCVAWITTQMIVNISVVLGFIPVLGVPLPFVSAGGTSLISTLMAVGVVLSCIREQALADGEAPSPADQQTNRARVSGEPS